MDRFLFKRPLKGEFPGVLDTNFSSWTPEGEEDECGQVERDMESHQLLQQLLQQLLHQLLHQQLLQLLQQLLHQQLLQLLQQLLHQLLHQQSHQLVQQQPRSLATLTGLVFKVTPAGDLGMDPGAR